MDARLTELLARVVATYRHALANSPDARDRLARRGVTDAALFDRFQVGFSEGALASMARGEVLEDLKLLGLLAADGRERFAGSVVIPAFDEAGAVVQLAGYAPDDVLTWLFPEETPVFWNAGCLKSARDAVAAPDPLTGLAKIAKGTEAVIAPAGPGVPLGQGAKDQLLAHAPRVTLSSGGEHLRKELVALGIDVAGGKPVRAERIADEDANGFTVEFARRLRLAVQGISQDSPRHLRASLKAFRQPIEGAIEAPAKIHLDTLDLYHARSRLGFTRTAACILGEDPTAVEEHLAKVVSLAEDFLRQRDKPAPVAIVSETEKAEAMEFLRDRKLLDRVLSDLAALGFVGEETNKLAAYMAGVSRKLDDPLSVLVVSRSAAGKSTLAEAVSMLAPPEDVLRFTRLTAQTLYYQKPDALSHKLVVIEEEAGVEDAAYALRILQSARKLSLSTAAGKGDSRTREVKGPVSLFVTTTRTDLDEETAGRFLTLSVDESKEQTRAILAAQREAEARSPSERERILRVHRNAQRLLAPLAVVNPYAPHLTFPDDRLSARRDHKKYLGLIRAVAFVHQHQRKVENGALTVGLDDIAVANRLAHHTLGQSLYDLAPPSRRLLMEVRDWLAERAGKEGAQVQDLRFSQRELREKTGWKKSQLAEHVRELVEAEYLVAHSVGPGRRTRYGLDWDGTGLGGERFVRGLVDVETLAALEASGSVQRGAGRSKPRRRGRAEAKEGPSEPSVRTSGKRNA